MGGAQRFLYELITHLNPLKYEFLVAVGRAYRQAGGNGELLQKLKEKGVATAPVKNFSNTPGLKNFLVFLEIFRLIKTFKPDVLYLSSSEAGFMGSIAGSFYRLFSRKKKPKIIYRIGGWAFKEPRNILIKKIILLAERFSAHLKDIIITNSEFDRQLGIKNKIAKPEKIITIYNGLDFNELKFLTKENARKLIGLKISGFEFTLNPILIGTVANLYKNKGLEYLILAASKLNNKGLNWRFTIIGEGPERLKIKNLIKKYGLENSIFLTGSLSDAFEYLKAFNLFVLPSVKEGQPWVILEAMAAEVPIVATNIAGIPETIENEKSGLLVEPADPQALALAIEKILTHPSLAETCAKNAFITIKEKFNLKTMIVKNEALFL
jgi:glycosyltransferase involved in cell wall biosynthesis